MKTLRAIAASLLLLPALAWAQAPQAPAKPEPEAPITKVVVFADRAEVTRSTTARCVGGKADVPFPGLPTSVDERTLRAEASGRARAIGTSHRVVAIEENLDERVAKLSKEIEALGDEIVEVEQAVRTHDERSADLDAYARYFLGLADEQVRSDKPDTARWAATLDSLTRQRLASAKVRSEHTLKLRTLRRKQDRLQRRLGKLGGKGRAEALRVAVAVDCGPEARPKVSLSYVVPQATWHPEYDLRFFPKGQAKVGPGKAELTVAAVVQQSTGEDWENVKIQLSTAKPRLGARAPLPRPIVVRGHEVGEEKVLVGKMERREKLKEAGASRDTGPESASLEDKGQSFALVMPHATTVHSDGRPYWMPVDVITTEGESRLLTIPKLDEYVYQVVKLANPAAYPLLEGRLHAYRGSSYVGDTHLAYKAPGEQMEVSLGIDEELRVERKDLQIKDRSAGFLSSTKHLERAYRILVRSSAKTPTAVDVRENIPVSKTEEVKVQLVKEKTTGGYSLDKHRGFVTWTLPLQPGQEGKVDLSYAIHLPEDWKVKIR